MPAQYGGVVSCICQSINVMLELEENKKRRYKRLEGPMSASQIGVQPILQAIGYCVTYDAIIIRFPTRHPQILNTDN